MLQHFGYFLVELLKAGKICMRAADKTRPEMVSVVAVWNFSTLGRGSFTLVAGT